MTECSFPRCKDAATVIVEKDGRPYCRGHGLSEASKRPACEIQRIPDQLDLELTHGIARCPACQSVVRYVDLDGQRLALEYATLKDARAGAVAFNRGTGGARRLVEGDLPSVLAWRRQGATIHQEHSEQCVGDAATTRKVGPGA